MCLSIAVNCPERVLAQGTHRGFEWVVTHNNLGNRCGYVRVPKGHAWHGKDYDEPDVTVHGGLTFAEPDYPCGKGGVDDGYWFGFDCGHHGDAADPLLQQEFSYASRGRGGVVRSQAYVEAQCRALADQAASDYGTGAQNAL